MNGLIIPIKSERLSELPKTEGSALHCVQQDHFKYKDTDRLRVKVGWKIFNDNTNSF